MSATADKESGHPRAEGERARGVRRKVCVVVGIGNPLMGDDGFGIEMAKALRRFNLGRRVLVLERQTMDFSILDSAKGASKLVIVDAVKSGRPPGSVVKFIVGRGPSPVLLVPLSHEVNLGDIFALARKSGIHPPLTVVVGVEPADSTAGKGLSVEVKEALPRALKEVRDEVKACLEKGNGAPS